MLAEARASRQAAPDLAALRAAVERARAALAAARAEEAGCRDSRATLAADATRITARRAAIGPERLEWARRRAEAAGRRAELAARAAEAAAERDALAERRHRRGAARQRRPRAGRGRGDACRAAAALAAAETEDREAPWPAAAPMPASPPPGDPASPRRRRRPGRGRGAGGGGAHRRAARRGASPLPEEVADLTDQAEEKARRKLDRLAREREEMGPVNLRAEAELNDLDATRARIESERQEVATAIAKLRGSIGHLNREGRERLRVVFDKVDTEFRALFTRLFGGGRAHLAWSAPTTRWRRDSRSMPNRRARSCPPSPCSRAASRR
jgi:chromosome segregation protein